MSTSNIDIQDIIDQFGLVYKASGQGVKDIRKQLFYTAETDRLFSRQLTDDTRLDGGEVEIGSVLQAYQDTFTPYGDTTWKGKMIDLYNLKIDWEKNPHAIEKSWLGFLAGDDIDPAKWPIIKYIINELIIKKAQEDWELNGIFKGSPATITAGTPQPIQNSIKGIKAQINEGITAGDITPISLGAVPTDEVDFVDYLEAFEAQIPEAAKPFLQELAMSTTLARRFRKGMRSKYNMSYDQMQLDKIADSQLTVSGFRSHEGSTKIWTTIKGNGVIGMKKIQNENVFKVESAKRMVSLFTDYWKGIGFWQLQYLWTNDVDLV